MISVFEDLRHGFKQLWRSPLFSLLVITTLVVGIGSTSVLFSIIKGVLLNPLPYSHPDELVALYGSTSGFERAPISYPNFLDWQTYTRSFTSIALYHSEDRNLAGGPEPERVSSYMVSAGFFQTLAVKPLVGREFQASEDHLGAAPVAMISDGFRQRHFGGFQNVIGQSLRLNGTAFTVIGVLPPSFAFYGQTKDVYTPIGQWSEPALRDREVVFSSGMVGRMRPGTTLAQAQADVEKVTRALAMEFPKANKDLHSAVVPMREDMTGSVRPFLMTLLAAVCLLLLIACANAANFYLARTVGRSREFAVRLALGAGPSRVVLHVLTESLILATVSGLAGIATAVLGTKAMLFLLPSTLPRADGISPDMRVLLFTLSVSFLAAILSGIVPALRASRTNLQSNLKQGGRGIASGGTWVQRTLVTGQVALALVLLAGAGLMIRTIAALWRVDPGFNANQLVSFNLSMPVSPDSTTPAETRARMRAYNRRMLQIPGVKGVSATLGSRPMVHASTEAFWIDGQPKPIDDDEWNQSLFTLAEPGLLDAMELRLKRGRFLAAHDDENSPAVMVIDEAFADRYFPHEDPIGKRVHLKILGKTAQIVGVVAHVRQWGLDEDKPLALEEQFYYSFVQLPEKMMPMMSTVVAVVLRTRDNPASTMSAVRRATLEIAPGDVIYKIQTMHEVIADSFASRRMTMNLLGLFAGLALILSCVGLYGVSSYLMRQKTGDIGVRIALGASRSDVLGLVIGEGAKLALAGILAGAALSGILIRFVNHLLFGVKAYDYVTFASVAGILFTVAIAACLVPGFRATRIDPMATLRGE